MIPRREFLGAGSAWLALLAIDRLPALAQGAPATPADPALISDLVTANHVLANEEVVDASGHISVRHPQRKDRFLLSRSIAPSQVTASDIMEYGLDGEPIDAHGRVSYKERFIHSEVYRARPDVDSVVHCHTPSVLPFADSDVPMRAMFHMASFVADGVPVWDIRKAGGVTDMLVSDTQLGRSLAQTLGNHPALLMRGHGAVVVANSIPNAVARAVYLGVNAKIQLEATSLGGHVTYVSPEEAHLRMADPNEYSRAWEMWKAKIR